MAYHVFSAVWTVDSQSLCVQTIAFDERQTLVKTLTSCIKSASMDTDIKY
jgi:hypothetical protein